jgi:hypothetical protein
MEALGRRLAVAVPETIFVFDLHGLRVEGAIVLLDTPKVRGQIGGTRHHGATPHG